MLRRRHHTPIRLLACALLGLVLAHLGCSTEETVGGTGGGAGSGGTGSGGGTTTGAANVTGVVTSPSGTTPVAYATVSIEPKQGAGFSDETEADAQGKYAFSGVPDGTYLLEAHKGHFSGQGEVTVAGGHATEPSVDLGVGIAKEKVAVLPGAYDQIGVVLTEMGIQFTTIAALQLKTWATIEGFEIVFANCGSAAIAGSPAVDNLRKLVEENGASYYASDWEYEWVATTWPEAVEFHAPEAKVGNVAEVVADVIDPDLAAVLGKEKMSINFDLGSWVVMDKPGTGTTVHVRGSVDTTDGMLADRPLLVTFPAGKGKVIYTSFHNEEQVTEDVMVVLQHFVFAL
jgi:hypothetical protein